MRYFDYQFPIDPATLPDNSEHEPFGKAWSEGAQGRAKLRALLSRQHYELAFWRAAQRDINYRRFFDVNELICLRVEEPAVFDATHRTVLRLVADGLVDGLRVDHIDGLLEPGRYLERLRAAVDARRPSTKRRLRTSSSNCSIAMRTAIGWGKSPVRDGPGSAGDVERARQGCDAPLGAGRSRHVSR